MTVTSIRQINNEATGAMIVRSHENGELIELEPGASIGTDMWIPWCDIRGDFDAGHFISISFNPPDVPPDITLPIRIFVLWQRREQVSFDKEAWRVNGACVPIHCLIGGDRLLTIRGSSLENFSIEVSLLR